MSEGRVYIPQEKTRNLSSGEERFISFLREKLPDDWKLYFKPHLNGSRPDLILVNPMVGIMVYSVLDDADGDPETEIKRLEYYKKKIIQQLIPSMGEMTDEDRKIYGIVRTGIYVDGMKTDDVEETFNGYERYVSCAGYDSLSEDCLELIIPALRYKKSRYMRPEWASELESWIIPPYHRDKRTGIHLTEEQQRHANPEPGHRRLKGVAGSGKTLVIAHRAAKLAAEGHRVLIVTFNRTLWYHIREMVDKTPYNFDWSLLTFRHFHGFCSDIINELRIPCDSQDPVECLLESIWDYDISDYRFDAILIDEGQDFEWEWYDLLSNFLTDRDELFFVCDKTQNIYERDLGWVDDMSGAGRVKFRGKWRELRTIHRLPPEISEFACKFGESFLQLNKSQFDVSQKTLFSESSVIWKNVNPDDWDAEIFEAYMSLKNKGANDSDIVVLVPTNEMGLRVAEFFRAYNKKTDHLFRENDKNSNKRIFASDNRMKISTIHSFKGWEARNVIIWIPEKWSHGENLDSVIYTAITRTMQNLIILNTAERYHHLGEDMEENIDIPQDVSEDESDFEVEKWAEKLPFPLASVIWAGLASDKYETRVKYLLQFFEVLSEFNFNLILSGLSSYGILFQEKLRESLSDSMEEWFYRPTFGNWTTKLFKLSRILRMALNDNYTRNQIRKSFGKPDDEFLRVLSDPDIPTILRKVSRYRNTWEGHGPRVSEDEYRKRYSILIGYLLELRDIMGDIYSRTSLVIPGEGVLNGGVYEYTVKRYMSTKFPFRAVKIKSNEPMDSSRIYLVTEHKRDHMELLPLIINVDDICYFYNGRDDETGQARYCSYHHTERAELLVPFDGLETVQKILEPHEG